MGQPSCCCDVSFFCACFSVWEQQEDLNSLLGLRLRPYVSLLMSHHKYGNLLKPLVLKSARGTPSGRLSHCRPLYPRKEMQMPTYTLSEPSFFPFLPCCDPVLVALSCSSTSQLQDRVKKEKKQSLNGFLSLLCKKMQNAVIE